MKRLPDFDVKELSYIPALDGLRGVAILLVFLRHFPYQLVAVGNIQTTFRNLIAVGFSGVDLFFVLSGYLITRPRISVYRQTGHFRLL